MVDLYTDASCNFNLGCGGVSDKEWYFIACEPEIYAKDTAKYWILRTICSSSWGSGLDTEILKYEYLFVLR